MILSPEHIQILLSSPFYEFKELTSNDKFFDSLIDRFYIKPADKKCMNIVSIGLYYTALSTPMIPNIYELIVRPVPYEDDSIHVLHLPETIIFDFINNFVFLKDSK